MVLVFIGDLWAFRGTSLPFVIDFLFTDLAGTAGFIPHEFRTEIKNSLMFFSCILLPS
jgi:hypothetical protein